MSAIELDVDGPAAPPRRNGELAFDHPWQSRLFATTMALCDNGTLAYDEFRLRLIAAIDRRPDEYWASWQDALEELLTERELIDRSHLDERARRFAGARLNQQPPARSTAERALLVVDGGEVGELVEAMVGVDEADRSAA